MKYIPLCFLAVALCTLGAHAANADAAHFAPFSQTQFETFTREFQDWKKKEKWELKNPQVSLDIIHDTTIRSMKLPDTVHALRIRFWEKGTTVGANPVDATGGAYREILGVEKNGGFMILMDSGYFTPECDADDYRRELLRPMLLGRKALVAVMDTHEHLGCAGVKGSEKKTLIFLDPSQNYAQVGEILMSSNQEGDAPAFASISQWGGEGDPTGVQDSWAQILVDRAEFKSLSGPDHVKQQIVKWNKDQTRLEFVRK